MKVFNIVASIVGGVLLIGIGLAIAGLPLSTSLIVGAGAILIASGVGKATVHNQTEGKEGSK